jgi:penicillin amidase
MRWIKLILSAGLLAGWLFLLQVPQPQWGIPFSLGRFFSPQAGFWQNAEPDSGHWALPSALPGLQAPVEVVYDERRVPHIFARNTHDVFFAQGYVTARDRLWQMEFQTHAAAGRLTEIIGRGQDDAVLELDRATRRLGMVYAAEKLLGSMRSNPESNAVLEAYCEGVNAYISSLRPADYPIEYKLLGYQPEAWTPLKCALMAKFMARQLTTGANDLEYTQALKKWGKAVFDVLYPEYPYGLTPIVPADTRFRPRDFDAAPERPKNYAPDTLLMRLPLQPEKPMQGLGSNNWAVAGARSATGRPLLANDPHLPLGFPAIWYEIQLSCPGMNVYGASLPAAPAVIVGFNDSIAWGITNGTQDVMDYYALKLKGDSVWFDGKWQSAERRVETFQVKGGRPVFDTVLYTHAGPVMYDGSFGGQPGPIAVRWMAHESSDDLFTFVRLNRARNYQDYLEALKSFVCPAQNFVFASASGDIAIWQHGKYVLKWPDQGRFLLDGSRRDHMWNQFIPFAQEPHVYNPERGFVASANQHPASPYYPHYYTGNFEDFRGRRLDQLLLADDSVSVEDMQRFQLDNYGLAAADILPLMLSELDTSRFDARAAEAYRRLKTWDFLYEAERPEPVWFEKWWGELYEGIWKDEFGQEGGPALDYPDRSTTIRILRDSLYFRFYGHFGDSVRTDRRSVVQSSYARAMKELSERYPDPAQISWGAYKGTTIRHLSRVLSPFHQKIAASGNGGILNATTSSSGPSWRMVVSLGPEPQAWGVYPGGPSGNPGSPAYNAYVADWVAGAYYSLWLMKGPRDESRKRSFAAVLKPAAFTP